MSSRPPIIPTLAPLRAIMLPASFAACGVLLLALFVVLMGCGQLLTVPPEEIVTPNNHNAILCSCECDGAVETAVPSANTIRVGADDVTQANGQTTAALTFPILTLGQGNYVGLRFQKLGVPPHATITSAYIQFSATQPDSGTADLDIRAVNSPNADAFTAATDLRALDPIGQIQWVPLPWIANNDREDAEKTGDLRALVQAIVKLDQYTPDSAVAFVITGSGRRIARAFEGQAIGGRPPALTVAYTPRKVTQEFLACGNPAEAAAVCGEKVQSNVTSIAQQCKLANACTCKVKTGPNIDTTAFSAVCNGNCPKVVAPDNCDPAGIAQTTAATASHTPVCVANSPLGSVLFGQLSACDIDESKSTVSVRVFDDEDSVTKTNNARGRMEFVGTPCPGDSCGVGMIHRMNVGDLTFNGGLFGSDHTLTQLSGVGASTLKAGLNNAGAGTFGVGWTKHSVRGHEEGGATVAVFKTNGTPINFGLGGWQPGGACTLQGMVLQTEHVEMFANLTGKLVNQPPTAVLGPDQTVECNDTGRAAFALDGSAHDPDNNVASFAWFRGSRTGQLVGTLPGLELEQPVNDTTSYVFKVVDALGQYAEATTKVSVVDTTAPTITAPGAVEAECTGPTGTPVNLGTATASDVCDASPTIGNNAPPVFALGSTTVTWSARDDSGNAGFATQQVLIKDTKPPELTVTLSPAVLWPPNHKLVPITASITVQDKCDPSPTVRLVSITSNEADNGLGDGDTTEDIQGAVLGTDDRSLLLRSERSGPGGGRVYTVTYKASDASGNTTLRTATVTVPKNQSAKP